MRPVCHHLSRSGDHDGAATSGHSRGRIEPRDHNDGRIGKIRPALSTSTGHGALRPPRGDGTSAVINLDEYVEKYVEILAAGSQEMIDDRTRVTVDKILKVRKITAEEALGVKELDLKGTILKTEKKVVVDEKETDRVLFVFSLQIDDSKIPLPVPARLTPESLITNVYEVEPSLLATNIVDFLDKVVELKVKACCSSL